MQGRLLRPVFYRIADELVQNEPEPFIICINIAFHRIYRYIYMILAQHVFIIRDCVTYHVSKGGFPNRIILFRMFTARIIKSLFRITVHMFQFCQHIPRKIRTMNIRMSDIKMSIFTEQLHRRNRCFGLMHPLFDILFIFFPFPLYFTYFFQHGFLCHFHDPVKDLFISPLRHFHDFGYQVPFL